MVAIVAEAVALTTAAVAVVAAHTAGAVADTRPPAEAMVDIGNKG